MRKSKHKQISRRSLSVVRGSSRESSAVGNWEEGAGKMASGRRRRVAWVSTIFAEGAVFARDKKAKRGKRRREANKQEREGEIPPFLPPALRSSLHLTLIRSPVSCPRPYLHRAKQKSLWTSLLLLPLWSCLVNTNRICATSSPNINVQNRHSTCTLNTRVVTIQSIARTSVTPCSNYDIVFSVRCAVCRAATLSCLNCTLIFPQSVKLFFYLENK